ncbi:MAG: flagellar basal body P-ring protein FlgI [Steroidobacteraceae bacterium]
MNIYRIAVALAVAVVSSPTLLAHAATVEPLESPRYDRALRSLVHIEGVRENALLGYGLVVGLQGTGDGTQVTFAGQSVVNMLKQFGVRLPEGGVDPRTKNVATVMVSAVFPPGYRKGQTVDVTVSSMGDAKSLRGGLLLLTPLHAADGEIYALGQGNLVVGGVTASGSSGSSVTLNSPTSGRIPNGATIEREIETDFATRPTVLLSLNLPSFQTATNIVLAINGRYGDVATTRDATSVEVVAPTNPTQRVAFVAGLESLSVAVGNALPKVVFNSRTGTVVISEGVRVRPAAISHGVLKVVITEAPIVSQPAPGSRVGQTTVVPRSQVSVQQDAKHMFLWPAGVSLKAIIDTVNSIGANPDDIMAILQALDQAGALDAELVVI